MLGTRATVPGLASQLGPGHSGVLQWAGGPACLGLCLGPPEDKGCVASLEPASFEELTGWGTASSVSSILTVAAAGVGWGLASGGALVTKVVMIMMTAAFYVY